LNQTGPATSPPAGPAVGRVAASPVDEFLQLLARAVQQFHTYPPTSPLCQNAIDLCARALTALDRDQLSFRISPAELIVDDMPVGRGTPVEHELARRLHAAFIAEVTIDRAASPRELSHLCLDLVCCSDAAVRGASLLDVLAEHGVDRIVVRAAYRPEVLSVSSSDASVTALVQVERRRREELFERGGTTNYLYPPDRGWVRLDPSSPLASVSLVELALLADGPERLAAMLVRLTDEDAAPPDAEALSRKFSDVAMIFSALEPRVARVMFSRLAQAVLQLEPETRQALLRRTILPGLLDGRVDGLVLRDFPDLELADSLCLLLDLETAAPELVTTALARLELAPDRESTVAPLVAQRMKARGKTTAENTLAEHAKKLVNVERGRGTSYAEFSAYDLALDSEAAGSLAQIRDGILDEDEPVLRLECLWQLTRLEPNPEAVQGFVDSALSVLLRLEHGERDAVSAEWMLGYRELADVLRDSRPDVADVITTTLARLCTDARASHVVDLAASGEPGRAVADQIVRALAPQVGLHLLNVATARPGDGRDDRGRTAVRLLCDHAVILAPAIAAAAERPEPVMQRVLARALGFAGAGFEATLGAQLASGDEQTVREALRSLARIGTVEAARLVCRQIEAGEGWIAGAAEETLWRFPAAEAQRHACALLGRRDFVLRRPATAVRFIERAANGKNAALASVLAPLQSLRYRIWRPALARVGRRAHALVAR
jgi:hypothetical protein